MAKIFSLDSYEKKAAQEYGSYQIRVDEDTVVELRNPMRLKDEARTELFEVVKELAPDKDETKEEDWNEVGNDVSEHDVARMSAAVVKILRLVGDENVEKLVTRIDGDIAVIMSIFSDYFKAVGLGEASTSRD